MRKLLVVCALAVLVAAGCGKDESTTTASTRSDPVKLSGDVNRHGDTDLGSAATLEVEQGDFYFGPTFVKARPGATVDVELKNEGESAHTFTIDALNIREDLQPGGTAEVAVKLPASGVVTYYCEFHKDQGMQGAFYFKAGGTASTGSSSERRSDY